MGSGILAVKWSDVDGTRVLSHVHSTVRVSVDSNGPWDTVAVSKVAISVRAAVVVSRVSDGPPGAGQRHAHHTHQ